MLPIVRFLIHAYQWTISPVLSWLGGPGSGCRFQPTCSRYFLEAVETHGLLYGSWLGLCRLGRCQPWGGQGHDPVPPAPSQCGRGLGAPTVAAPRRLPHSEHLVCE